jgi:tRNA1Val (adenine37-N6)-methyltransferase
LGQARHTLSLSYADLITNSFSVLKPKGKLTVVLPYSSRNFFVEQSLMAGFFLLRELLIFPRRGMPPNRVYLSLSKSLANSHAEMLSLREEDGRFSSEYLDLVKNYYL